jgi:hypothetical protein
MKARNFGLVTIGVLLGVFPTGCEDRQRNNSTPLPPPLREDLVKPGMSTREVEVLIGKPERVVSELENGLEAWTYYEHEDNLSPGIQLGGLTVVFKDEKVHKVMPISEHTRQH